MNSIILKKKKHGPFLKGGREGVVIFFFGNFERKMLPPPFLHPQGRTAEKYNTN